jgi:hypothetical protein
MELMDTFSKYDQQLDGSCKRNEQIYFSTAQELGKEPTLVIDIAHRGGKRE